MKKKLIESTMRLFKGWDPAVLVGDVKASYVTSLLDYMVVTSASEISKGVFDAAVDLYGINPNNINNTFHKSFATVRDSDYRLLVRQQLMHYMTTYGFEALGIYDKDVVYIPNEVQEGCAAVAGLKLAVIHPYTKDQLRDKLKVFVGADVGLSEAVIESVIVLLGYYFSKAELAEMVSTFKNRELMIRVCEELEIIPMEADAFLRLMIYKATGRSLLIKNRHVLSALKMYVARDANNVIKWLGGLDMVRLAASYHRFHEYWLAFKQQDAYVGVYNARLGDNCVKINKFINRLSKLADKYHRPLPINALQNVDLATISELEVAVLKASDAQLLRVWGYVLTQVRASGENSDYAVTYNIRNNTSWTKKVKAKVLSALVPKLHVIEKELVKRYSRLAGKTIFLPNGIDYPMYTSGKSTVGAVPQGTTLNLDMSEKATDNIIVAIHWQNLTREGEVCGRRYGDNGRVDLDLHAALIGQHIGWNSNYRDSECEILFSGDITDAPAPRGATEAILLKFKKDAATVSFNVNNYTNSCTDVPFDLIIARGDDLQLERDLVIDPARIIAKFKSVVTEGKNQQELGTLIRSGGGYSFMLGGRDIGNSIITRNNELQTLRREANEFKFIYRPLLVDFFSRILGVTSVESDELPKVVGVGVEGLQVLTGIPEDFDKSTVDFDLSLQGIQEDTFPKLFFGVPEPDTETA